MDDMITVIGNLAGEPESRGSATPITSFRIASTQRRLDRETGRWVDGQVNWYNVSAFRQLAVHALESLHKGQRVIVTGRLKIRDWETSAAKGTSVDIEAEAIGHDLLWGTSHFQRADAGGSRTQPAATEWAVRTPGEEPGDAWAPPMGTAVSGSEPASEAVVAQTAAPEPAYAGAGREPVYAGADERPF